MRGTGDHNDMKSYRIAEQEYLEAMRMAKINTNVKAVAVCATIVTVLILLYFLFPNAPEVAIKNVSFQDITAFVDTENIQNSRMNISLSFTISVYNDNLFKLKRGARWHQI